MKCPKCQFINRKGVKFCEGCGIKLELSCPQCGTTLPVDRRFCGECGHKLVEAKEASSDQHERESQRKYVTALFSDISGYTSMFENLDPEEVREITRRILGELSKIIHKYEGFIEKFAGDAVMALFGVPAVHEDDPIRAIRAAREIHDLVASVSPEIETKIGRPISMHTGIHTGMVVTGEVNLEKGSHGVAGDALNVASRLSSAATSDEILVSQMTFRQSLGYFEFEVQAPLQIKGKPKPLIVYKVLSSKDPLTGIRRLSILKADLIGRRAELAELMDAVVGLRNGTGRLFSITGDAGTGKSRLVEEFRARLGTDDIQWLECHAYAYSQNIPYFPLMDLLNRLFHIEEEDPRDLVRQKVEAGIRSLVEGGENLIPYMGSLYAVHYPEAEEVSPEFWKAKLQVAMKTVISTLARRSPTVFLLEDLHWADPSFVDLLRNTLLEVREPAIVLCVYRPTFSLFTSHQLRGLEKIHREIRIQDLSVSEAQDMLASLLMTHQIPPELLRFVQEKAEGNPFYLEEMVNSLIESEILVREGKTWKLTGPIRDSTISSTIHVIIAGRLDRLEKEAKRVLQEASVIGRSFLYEILHRVSELKQDMDRYLRSLEQMDLIRTKTVYPELEYVFKHALTQEVVYNGLLKRERRDIHERIGLVMEQLFQDRLQEFYEALAFHFSHGSSVLKAVEYLVKSGEKSHKRYSLEEAHQYFKEAYELLTSETYRTREEDCRIIDILLEWGYVHNSRADYKGMEELLLANEDLVTSLEDKERLGMFYAWVGWALRSREKLREGHEYLLKALRLGEEIQGTKIVGYACAWLTWACADRGLLDDAVTYGRRAQELFQAVESDAELVRYTLGGLGVAHYFRGDCAETYKIGELMLDYGQRRSDLRCITMGHNCIGFSHYVAGNLSLAIQSFKNGIQVSEDTITTNASRLLLGMTYVADSQLKEAEATLEEVMRTNEDRGFEFLGTAAQFFYGVVLLSQGNLNKGVETIEDVSRIFLESDSKYRYATANYTMEKVYSRVVLGESEKSISLIAKNIGFLVKNIATASKKAETHFDIAIDMAKEIGAEGILGQAYLDLALLHKAKKRKQVAAKCLGKAIESFEKCGADAYLHQAHEALVSIQ